MWFKQVTPFRVFELLEAKGSCDDAESMAYATQLLMAAALSVILGELVDLLGGWQE